MSTWSLGSEWFARKYTWKQDIANLRLVNAHLASSVQHLLFQNVKLRLDPKAGTSSDWLANLVRLSRSELAGHVKSLNITLSGIDEYSSEEDRDAGKRVEIFFQDLAQCLPLCVQAFRNLRSLDMLYRHCDFWKHWPDDFMEFVPLDYCQQINTMVATILTHTSLDCLRDLTIRLPCTRDIHTIMEYDSDGTYSQCRLPLARTMSCLRSLSLELCDFSGPNGHRYNERPPSMLLQTFGLQEHYAQSLFDFASMARNLESLAISCTAPLNFDLFVKNRLYNLKNLSLNNVNTTGEQLLRFLAQNQSSLETICLTQVYLMSRTWEDVFVQLRGFPLLLKVWIESCGYAADGDSSQFRIDPWPDYVDVESLESTRSRDKYALGDVTRFLNPRRRERGLDEFTTCQEGYIKLPPLSELTSD